MVKFLCLIALLLVGIAPLDAASAYGLTSSHMLPWSWTLPVVFGVAAASTGALTLLDIAKRLDPNGAVARIVENLTQTNEILTDAVVKEGNLVTGERTTIRTGLPDVFWRLYNYGIPTSKSHTAQIDEQCGMLEAYSQVDRDLAELGGNAAAVRFSEARAYWEAMNQEMASTFFYGSALAAEEFIGLAARYSSLSAGNADNIVVGGGSGSTDNTSIWLVSWDEEALCMIYPKGSKAGIFHEDLGLETAENAAGVSGNLMRVYRDHWQWKTGIALKDWRYVVRIPNIDVSNLSNASDAADLLYLMAEAEERIPNNLGRRAFYVNRTIRRFLRHQTKAQVSTGGGITFENVAGKRVMMFDQTPVRLVDAILNTEDVVA